ncbi:MAG: transcription-repair coupling factor [Dehalococcoidia bacterium]|nr:transcription-repair coupling factor [Dehalococcoidia bacterium]
MPLDAILESLSAHIWDSAIPVAPSNESVTVRNGARAAYIAAAYKRMGLPTLILTPRPEDARRLHDQLLTYLGDSHPIHIFPSSDVLPFERLAVDLSTSHERLSALSALWEANHEEVSEQPIVIAPVVAVLRSVFSPELLSSVLASSPYGKGLKVGERIPKVEDLLQYWVSLGYRNQPLVESPGEFSQRGGILDIFPVNHGLPIRIELFDDEVDTIREFDPITQRSIRDVTLFTVIPAKEQLPNLTDRTEIDEAIGRLQFDKCSQDTKDRIEDDLVSLFSESDIETLHLYNGLVNQNSILDYLPDNGLLVIDRESQVEAETYDVQEKYARMRESREGRGELPGNFPTPYLDWSALSKSLYSSPCQKLKVQSILSGELDNLFKDAGQFYGRMEDLTAYLDAEQKLGSVIFIVSQHSSGRINEILSDSGVLTSKYEQLDAERTIESGKVYLVNGSLSEGWKTPLAQISSEASLILLTDYELFGTSKRTSNRRSVRHTSNENNIALADLIPGTYVVHIDHGVARFAGMTRMGDGSSEKEYLMLEYADSDKLYVPTDQLDRVGSYIGSQDQTPNLTRLGTAEWSRVKERVRESTREIAQELIQLYAERKMAVGHRFTDDTVWQSELEDSFPFLETPDQLEAIDQVKNDMQQSRPMDRLICGDVGYGKTEVALRAAFKTVSEGMQVAVLVPTTVLAQQHYATLSERLSPYPVNVEVLSRFRTSKEQENVIARMDSGEVDIVIGTHRLLQKDVRFKNLGLVVVDEEQRFGVSHKERFKALRKEVDVLTLSATPIPRTLHMALAGIRDMSIIRTPPEARLPVKTFVSEYSEDIIKEAILRELERGGQVFFLHNRVRTIDQKAAELSELVPEARIVVGHGQMNEDDLESVMTDFGNYKADVLVCTTIIESGIDMPNVNTLLIDRADRFGLSQLYQLRGRVGRGEHRAYAYLLMPAGRRVTETAEQRVEAILEASELGSGFRISMRDMEIRGAGNLLGSAQSGQIHSVGLSLYSQLLEEAVLLLSNETENGEDNSQVSLNDLPRMDVDLPSTIPEEYVSHLPTRLGLYQRLGRILNREELDQIEEELTDRFGALPDTVVNLLELVDLRALAASVDIESIVQSGDSITARLRNPVGSARSPLQKALGPSASVGLHQISMSSRSLGDEWVGRFKNILERLRVFRDSLQAMSG